MIRLKIEDANEPSDKNRSFRVEPSFILRLAQSCARTRSEGFEIVRKSGESKKIVSLAMVHDS